MRPPALYLAERVFNSMSSFINNKVKFHSMDDDGILHLQVGEEEVDDGIFSNVYSLDEFMKNVRANEQSMQEERLRLLDRIAELEGGNIDHQQLAPVDRSLISFAGRYYLSETRENMNDPYSEQFRILPIRYSEGPYCERIQTAIRKEILSEELS